MSRARVLLVLGAVGALAAPLMLGTSAAATDTSAFAYISYPVGINGGEPGIGYDPKADAALYTGPNAETRRLTWDDSTAPATMKVVDASPTTSITSLDPIMFTDQQTHRTFVSHLVGACSLMSFSDDAGRTWTPSQGCGPDVLLDHQTVGGGPYPEGKPPTAGVTGYPNAVYYCAQNGYSGTCARSDDGGQTFGPGTPAYNTPANGAPDGGACSAIHGHLRVGPDGTAYLPNKGCGGTPTAQNLTNSEFFGGSPALSVSEDAGTTWTVHPVPGGHNQDESDPSVATDRSGRVFFGWEDGVNPSETVYGTTSAAKIAVSTDHGKTWSTPYDVSSALGLHNVQFPEVIAGDPGRAAFSFLGTPGVGDDQHVGFVGEWHLYVATTLDAGKTWTTVDATPGNPVQRGCISLQGTSNKTVLDQAICDQRNLLDFNDITVDKIGRVLMSYADGCKDACTDDPKSGSKSDDDIVLRQSGGPLLYANTAYPTTPVATGGQPPASGPTGPVAGPGPTTSGQHLAATGAGSALPVLAMLLIAAALVLLRRRRTA